MTLLQKTLRHKRKIQRFFFVCLSILSYLTAHAQTPQVVATTETTEPVAKKDISIGLNLGVTNGVGVDVAYHFSKHWAGRLAFNYAHYAKNDYTYDIASTNSDGTKNNQKLSFDGAINFSNIALNFEFMPTKKGRFKLIGGVAYFPTNTLTVSGELASSIKFNDVLLNPEDLGSGDVTIGYSQKISPYIGMGFGRTFPRKRLNVSFDFGSYYKGDYKVNIEVQPGAILEENESNAAILERNLNQNWYQKLMPVMNLRLAYRIQ